MDNLLEAMPTVSDTQILTIFKGVLDDASVEKLEGEQFGDPDMTYEEFFATMDLEFGGEDHTNLRSKWYNLRVRHSGSLKLRDWRSFSAPFFKLMAMVEDATEEEAERLMLKALPVEWRRKVEIEVSKRNREGQMVVEGLPLQLDEAMVHQFITAETGVQPKRVKVLAPGKWRIQGQDEEHRREIMRMDRQRLDNGVRIVVKLVEDRLHVKDIDALMRRWLQVDDRVSQVTRGDRQDDRPRRDDRNRFTREVTVDDMDVDSERIAAVGEAIKGKQKARSTEPHPKKSKDAEAKAKVKEPENESKTAPSANTTPVQAAPQQAPREAIPQWTPEPQWWYGEHWSRPTYWVPDWSSWGAGKGAGYTGGGQHNWGSHKGGKGDKGGKGAKGRKGGQDGSGASQAGRGKGGERQ